jgi:Cys-tRNA synthase (O-phospho-L-seryl-tRNA:Cys-tRNA synthase)
VKELERHNASAARSLEEGLDETLTLHRLEVFTKLGISFKTTNLIESVMARVEAKTHRITRWRTSDQKQRWCAATLLEIEKQFRKVKGHQHLGLLQAALRSKLSSTLAAA